MTQLDVYASALEDMSRRFLRIAATENRWDSDTLRDHARALDRIAVELMIEDAAPPSGWRG